MRFGTVAVSALLLVSGLFAPALAAGEAVNVGLTITMGTVDGENKTPVKSYRMVLESGGPSSEMLAGSRVAIPVTRFQSMDGGAVHPTTSFTYQNVGFTAKAEGRVLEGGAIEVNLNIEDSHIVGDAPPGSQPQIATRSQRLGAVLDAGQPLEIMRIDDPVLGAMYCDVSAEIVP